MAKKETAVAEKANTDLATGFEEYGTTGFENQTQDDYSIPWLAILEALSPALDENKELRPGWLYNSATGEAYPDGIAFVPATTKHCFVEFKPRGEGGGFVATHEPDSNVVRDCKTNQDFGEYKIHGNDLIETFYVYGVALEPDGGIIPMAISFSGTRIKKYKNWMTKARTVQLTNASGKRFPAPLFAHRYMLKTIADSSPKGKFNNWQITFDGATAAEARLDPQGDIVKEARSMIELVRSGDVKLDQTAAGATAPAPAEDGEAF